jgi:hypothetical protein
MAATDKSEWISGGILSRRLRIRTASANSVAAVIKEPRNTATTSTGRTGILAALVRSSSEPHVDVDAGVNRAEARDEGLHDEECSQTTHPERSVGKSLHNVG